MSLPKAKVNLYERRITRLKRQIEKSKELRTQNANVFALTREHYAAVVASHLAKARGLEATIQHRDNKILEDTFRIQELDNQVAVQWKNLAEAKDDAARYHMQCVAFGKELNQLRNDLSRSKSHSQLQFETIEDLLKQRAELERSLLNRLWVAIPIQWARLCQLIAIQLTTRRDRIVNRFKIWRLNRARVEAISEGGYIPGGLVKIAQRYWEEDQKRLKIDEQIRNIHYGRETPSIAVVERVTKPSLLRRLAIILGRA